MKNKYFLIATVAVVVGMSACNKNVDVRSLPDFEPLTLDSVGGNWKTVLLTDGGEVSIPAPEPVTSPAYIAELNKILEMQSQLTAADRAVIDRWKNSGIIKWNEKARELVSK
ncbi:MAG TPA: hypothetical protein VD996_01865, partial [Chitinophagaceae bacterium]|nr:hypothetical protein [Chitinophagaceae bacterium]